ncbi:MAG: hypothetical protein OXP28_04485 [Gammaproteobacteria bacterium]|nr:hypothetical protein [Gammaproteobacteria bacterium]MDE0224376.1 hypothetical protein [Gammaproteobacteria bacterium]
MRELTISEAEQAAGGLGFVASLVVALVGSYIYEQAGGAEGINKAVQAVADHVEDTFEKYGPSCSGSDPSMCMAG